MKKSLLAGFIGIAIVIALDAFSRVVISVYLQHEILMISYTSYPGGIFWPWLLTGIAAISSFLGGWFCLTYGRDHRIISAMLFLILLVVLRYGQLHLLIDQESIFYPVTALLLSLAGVFLAWQLSRRKKEETHEEFDDYDEYEPVE